VIRALAPLCAALACLAIACGSSGGADTPDKTPTAIAVVETPAVASCIPARQAPAGDSTGSVTSGGLERTYILHVPPSYDGTSPTPLVLVFHGFGLTAEAVATYSRFSTIADEQGSIVVYPAGQSNPPMWNINQDVTIADDVLFANDLITKLDGELCIDEDAVYAVGFSNGGAMAQRLVCANPDRIAGLATVAAIYTECKAAVPWIAFHGMDDPIVPFEGGTASNGAPLLPARRILSEWARELGCDGLAQISRPAEAVELSTYVNCLRGSGDVLLYTLIRAGHTWPGSEDLPPDIAGATSKQIDATAAIWEFFAAHPLAH
jgi:polyhydroxybutyrate depolymerase